MTTEVVFFGALLVGSGWCNLAPKMGTSMALPIDSRREAKRLAGLFVKTERGRL